MASLQPPPRATSKTGAGRWVLLAIGLGIVGYFVSGSGPLDAFDWVLAAATTVVWAVAALNARSTLGRVILWLILLLQALGWGILLGLIGSGVLGLIDSGQVLVGECLNSSHIASSAGPVDDQGLELVSCDEAHDYETFAVVDYPAETQGAYSGDVLASYGASECMNPFAEFVGASWFEAGYDINPIIPNEDGWQAGDRTILCTLTRLDGQRAVESARNSGPIVPEGYLSLFRLEEGDCFDDTDWGVFGLPVSCESAHDNEVYAVLTSPSELGADYPEADEVASKLVGGCARNFANRVDPELAAELDYGPVAFPVPFTWVLGHRTYVCALWDRDLSKLSGSQLLAHRRFDALIGDEFQDQAPTVSFPDFTSVDGLELIGSAHQADKVLSLTTFAEHAQRGAPFEDERPQRGAAWFSEKVPVEHGFETAFVFQLEMYSWFTIGDGFAFVIQDSGAAALGDGQSGMGYKGIPNSVAIEFDPVRHGHESDPATSVEGAPDLLANHVSVHSQGTQPNTSHTGASLGWADLGEEARLSDRAAHVALVRYVPGEMTVFVDEFETPALTIEIDLSETLQLDAGSAYVGFTASSGPRITGHKILAWELASTASTSSSTASTSSSNAPEPFDFDEVSDVKLMGTATWLDSVLRLTASKNQIQAGAAWRIEKQTVTDGFETVFQFRISGIEQNPGDGFAFVIQNSSESALGDVASGVGYKGIRNSVAVEFDTTFHNYEQDPNGNHVGIHTLGPEPNTSHQSSSLGSATPQLELWDGVIHTVRIAYSPGTMSVFLDDLENPILEVELNLADTLRLDDGQAWVGFTASTEPGFRETHDVIQWTFSSQ